MEFSCGTGMNDSDSGTPITLLRMIGHQGGWDEILQVLVPITFIAFLLAVANRRAKRLGRKKDLPSDAPG
jgi:hypothetical protein